MNDSRWGDLGFGLTMGFLLGALLMTAFAVYVRDRGCDECEAPLTRTERCVQKWVPAPTNPTPDGGGQ